MPSRHFEFRVPFYKLLTGLLVTVVPISIAGLYGVSQSSRSLQGAIGSHFTTIAASTAAEISQFIHERVIEVGLLAAEPVLVDAVAVANKSYQGMSDAAIAAGIGKIDNAWNTPAVDPIVKEILSSRVSRVLRRRLELDPRILRITVTDARGATIAATHKTSDYFQADEEYWQSIYAQGKGAMSLTDVLHDDVTKADYVGVGVPVVEEGSNRFIGTLDALVDVSSLSPIVNRSPISPTGRILLVKEDGTVICAPQTTLSMNSKSGEYAAVQQAMGVLAERQTGYVVADVVGASRQVIGFANTGLKQDYRNLGWVALVSQDARQAFAPIRFVDRLIFFVSALGLAMVTLLVLYFAMHRRVVFAEVGELVHGTAAPIGRNVTVPREEGSKASEYNS